MGESALSPNPLGIKIVWAMSHIQNWQFQLLVWQLYINSVGLVFLFSHSMSIHVTNDELSEYLKPFVSSSYFYMHRTQDLEIDVETE